MHVVGGQCHCHRAPVTSGCRQRPWTIGRTRRRDRGRRCRSRTSISGCRQRLPTIGRTRRRDRGRRRRFRTSTSGRRQRSGGRCRQRAPDKQADQRSEPQDYRSDTPLQGAALTHYVIRARRHPTRHRECRRQVVCRQRLCHRVWTASDRARSKVNAVRSSASSSTGQRPRRKRKAGG